MPYSEIYLDQSPPISSFLWVTSLTQVNIAKGLCHIFSVLKNSLGGCLELGWACPPGLGLGRLVQVWVGRKRFHFESLWGRVLLLMEILDLLHLGNFFILIGKNSDSTFVETLLPKHTRPYLCGWQQWPGPCSWG